MTIPLQTGFVYGSLASRRFGRSLGINLLPTDQKICNLDCVYCQYENTPPGGKPRFPSLKELTDEFMDVVGSLRSHQRSVDWIIIAGNGEPTLHPQFPEAVDCLLGLRNEFLPNVPVGILSNSSTCHLPPMRQALSCLEGRYMKLDAGNIPDAAVLAGLHDLKGTVLQSLFFEGIQQNTASAEIGEWMDIVRRVRPKSVQIYTIDRSTRLKGLRPVPKEVLQRISDDLFARTEIPSRLY